MTVFDIIKKDHREVKDLLKYIKKLGSKIASHKELMSTIYELFKFHNNLEEKLIYNPLEDSENEIFFLTAKEEHHLVESFFDELEEFETGNPAWQARFKILKDTLERHIKNEENKGFKLMEKAFSKGQLNGILNQFQKKKS